MHSSIPFHTSSLFEYFNSVDLSCVVYQSIRVPTSFSMASVLEAVLIPSSEGTHPLEDDGYVSEIDDSNGNTRPAATRVLSFNGQLHKFVFTGNSQSLALKTEHSFSDVDDSSAQSSPVSSVESPCDQKNERNFRKSRHANRRPVPISVWPPTVEDITSEDVHVKRRQSDRSADSDTLDSSNGHHIHRARLDTGTPVEFVGEALTPKRRGFRREWTEDERQTLCVLRRWYTNSWDETVEILNQWFEKASLVRRQPPFRKGMCVAMHHMKDRVWRTVCLETLFDDPHNIFTMRRRQLERFSETIGIDLVARMADGDMMKKGQNLCENGRTKDKPQSTLHDYEETAPVAQRLRSMRPRVSAQSQSYQATDTSRAISAIEQMQDYLAQQNNIGRAEYSSPDTSPLSRTDGLARQFDHQAPLDSTQQISTDVPGTYPFTF